MKKLNSKRLIGSLACVLCVAIVFLVGKLLTDQNSARYNDKDFVAVLDVDQGDSILISSNGRAALIDTGRNMYAGDILREVRGYGVRTLDALIISHSHDDHAGGAEYLLQNMQVENIVIPDFRSDENVTALNTAIYSSGAEVYTATEGMVINIGDFVITVIYADNSDDDKNNRSLILMAEISGKKFLFTGDSEAESEQALIDNEINFDCDVLKVGHHGSRTSSTEEFLEIATPKYAAISVGENNSYGLPDEDVIERLQDMGAEVLRTDYSGSILFFVENGEIVREQ